MRLLSAQLRLRNNADRPRPVGMAGETDPPAVSCAGPIAEPADADGVPNLCADDTAALARASSVSPPGPLPPEIP
jgi:hypothetical protein